MHVRIVWRKSFRPELICPQTVINVITAIEGHCRVYVNINPTNQQVLPHTDHTHLHQVKEDRVGRGTTFSPGQLFSHPRTKGTPFLKNNNNDWSLSVLFRFRCKLLFIILSIGSSFSSAIEGNRQETMTGRLENEGKRQEKRFRDHHSHHHRHRRDDHQDRRLNFETVIMPVVGE